MLEVRLPHHLGKVNEVFEKIMVSPGPTDEWSFLFTKRKSEAMFQLEGEIK